VIHRKCTEKDSKEEKSLVYIDASLQLLVDLGLEVKDVELDVKKVDAPFLVIPCSPTRWGLNDSLPDAKTWSKVDVYKVSCRIQNQFIPIPLLLFLRDLFEDSGILTYSLYNAKLLRENDQYIAARFMPVDDTISLNGLSYALLYRYATFVPYTSGFLRKSLKSVNSPKIWSLKLNALTGEQLLMLLKSFAKRFSGAREFRVVTPGWSSHDHFTFSDVNLSSQFLRWAEGRRYSLMGQIGSACAAEGGFSLPHCPGSSLLLNNKLASDWRNDCRGTTQYQGRSNVACWAMIAFREAIEQFAVATEHYLNSDSCRIWQPPLYNDPIHINVFSMMLYEDKKWEISYRCHSFWDPDLLKAFLARNNYAGLVEFSLPNGHLHLSGTRLQNDQKLLTDVKEFATIAQRWDINDTKGRQHGWSKDVKNIGQVMSGDPLLFVAVPKNSSAEWWANVEKEIDKWILLREDTTLAKQSFWQRVIASDGYNMDPTDNQIDKKFRLTFSEMKIYLDAGHQFVRAICYKPPTKSSDSIYSTPYHVLAWITAPTYFNQVTSAKAILPLTLAAQKLFTSIILQKKEQAAVAAKAATTDKRPKRKRNEQKTNDASKRTKLILTSTTKTTTAAAPAPAAAAAAAAASASAASDASVEIDVKCVDVDGWPPVVAVVLTPPDKITAPVKRLLLSMRILPIEGSFGSCDIHTIRQLYSTPVNNHFIHLFLLDNFF